MKPRIMVILSLIMVMAGCSATGGKPLISMDPTLLKAQADEMNALKSEVKGDMSAVKGDISAMKGNIGEIAAVKGDVSALKGDIKELSAQLSLQGQAVAGFRNDLKTITAGRDVVTTTTNDTDLLKFIFDKWWMIFVALIGLMKWNSLRDDKKHAAEIKRILAEKRDYKDNFLARCIKDEKELVEFRKHHEEVKKIV